MKKTELLLTAAQAKALDRKALEKFGISTLALMENAGRVIAEEVLKELRNNKVRVAILCGRGNNGGDGFCAARHLLAEGVQVNVYLIGKVADVEDEARMNLSVLLKLKQKITEISLRKTVFLRNKLGQYGLIVDALLGTGARGQIRPLYQEVIDLINTCGVFVLSVDIPSGLDATTGKAIGRCIRANKTVTFVAKKRGMVDAEGKGYCGKILIKNIGLPIACFK